MIIKFALIILGLLSLVWLVFSFLWIGYYLRKKGKLFK